MRAWNRDRRASGNCRAGSKQNSNHLEISTLPAAGEMEKDISETHNSAEKLTAEIAAAETAVDVPKVALSDETAKLHELEQRLAGLKGNSETIQASLTAGRDHMQR